MSTRQILLFCAATFFLTLGGLTLLFQGAALTPEALAQATTPQSMESFKSINLGSPYGSVSMADLVGNYIEHPPKAAAGPAAQPTHIGGC